MSVRRRRDDGSNCMPSEEALSGKHVRPQEIYEIEEMWDEAHTLRSLAEKKKKEGDIGESERLFLKAAELDDESQAKTFRIFQDYFPCPYRKKKGQDRKSVV